MAIDRAREGSGLSRGEWLKQRAEGAALLDFSVRRGAPQQDVQEAMVALTSKLDAIKAAIGRSLYKP